MILHVFHANYLTWLLQQFQELFNQLFVNLNGKQHIYEVKILQYSDDSILYYKDLFCDPQPQPPIFYKKV